MAPNCWFRLSQLHVSAHEAILYSLRTLVCCGFFFATQGVAQEWLASSVSGDNNITIAPSTSSTLISLAPKDPPPNAPSPQDIQFPQTYNNAQIIIAARKALADSAPNGWCGRGVFNVLNVLNLSQGLRSLNGNDWTMMLQKANWTPIKVSSPEKAPHFSILVYESDVQKFGKPMRKSRGGLWGHVELVLVSSFNERWYIADEVRFKPGGSVYDNFTGVAWLPPSPSSRPLASAIGSPSEIRRTR